MHLRLAVEEKYIFTYLSFSNFCTYVSEYCFQTPLYAYFLINQLLIMIKDFVLRNFWGACSSVKMLKRYMFFFQNAEGVHASLLEC